MIHHSLSIATATAKNCVKSPQFDSVSLNVGPTSSELILMWPFVVCPPSHWQTYARVFMNNAESFWNHEERCHDKRSLMRHENNMYNPSSPGACWVMVCQECFGAVLITGILDYPLINRPVAEITQSPKGCVCVCVICFFLNVLIIETIATCSHLRQTFFYSFGVSVMLAFIIAMERNSDSVDEFQ